MRGSDFVDTVLSLNDEHIKLLVKVARELATFQERGYKVKSMEVIYGVL